MLARLRVLAIPFRWRFAEEFECAGQAGQDFSLKKVSVLQEEMFVSLRNSFKRVSPGGVDSLRTECVVTAEHSLQ